jgi:serine/threonine protein kinase
LGAYKIERKLGEGAFTYVFLAHDKTSFLGKKIALKFPKYQSLAKEWTQKLMLEGEIWEKLSIGNHPNILSIEDLKRVSPFTFFVMEYLDGGNLSDMIESVPDAKKTKTIINLIRPICEGLAFAHSKGIIHGDIKPQNILVSKNLKSVKICDFGLSSALKDEESPIEGLFDKILGTKYFVAPELFDGTKTYQADIFALGKTLFFLLCNDGFLSDPQEYSLVHNESGQRKYNSSFIDYTALRLDTPSWLIEVIRRCTADKPEERFSSAIELLENIVSIIEPVKGRNTVISVWCNPEREQIEYDIENNGNRVLEVLSKEISYQTIKSIFENWQKLGALALLRCETIQDELATRDIDEKINELFEVVSEAGSHFVFGSKVKKIIAEQSRSYLWLLHDPRLEVIPWELLDIEGLPLCRRFPMSRWSKLMKKEFYHSKLKMNEKIRILVIADPYEDLDNAYDECCRLKDEASKSPFFERLEVEIVDGTVDSLILRNKMRKCNILHFAGHGLIADNSGDLSGCGLFLKGSPDENPENCDILSGRSLEGFWDKHAPFLVFANACSSSKPSHAAWHKRKFSDAALGLAHSFLSAGAASYIGTIWDIPDDKVTKEFSLKFYKEFFSGNSLGQSLLMARVSSVEKFGKNNLAWAQYIMFGDPTINIPMV